MELLICTLSGFALAIVAPGLCKMLGNRAGLLFAALPLALAAYFWQSIGQHDDAPLRETYRWLPELGLSLSFYLDGLSLFFALLITSVGTIVAVYSTGYLSEHIGTFYAYMLSFMAAMLGLVLAGNLLTLYLFWELTTLTSFLLIGFEHEKADARAAAVQALLVTAVGGLAMLAGLVLLGMAGGSYDIPTLLGSGEAVRQHALYTPIVLLLLLGAFTKSAQFPFHFWLPDAMEAPAPVSAYLHSATMVKAGVYLIARMTPILHGSELWSSLLIAAGVATMLLGAYLAFWRHDLKAILAYLTINVLGTLVLLLGIGGKLACKAAFVYLAAHAAYKGALFLIAGAVDHQTSERDIRQMHRLRRAMPITAALAAISALSMLGMVPLAGFLAKEVALEAVWKGPAASWLTAAMVAGSALLAAGAGLVGIRPFFGGDASNTRDVQEASWQLWMAPAVLTAASVALGLFPQQALAPLVGPAVAAVTQHPAEVELKLWHGWTAPLGFSVLAIVGGVALFGVRERLLSAVPTVCQGRGWGPRQATQQLAGGVVQAARWQTRLLQHGRLRFYVATVMGVFTLLVGGLTTLLLARTEVPLARHEPVGVEFHEAIAAGLIVAAAWVAVTSRSRLRAVASLGIVGYSASWIYGAFAAPDLAMTQIVVESLTVLLFVLALHHLPPFTHCTRPATRFWQALLSIAAGGAITGLLLIVTKFERIAPVSSYYAEHALEEAHGRNVVNVILVDFRAFDTLGEVTVLSVAAVGVFALTKLVVSRRNPS